MRLQGNLLILIGLLAIGCASTQPDTQRHTVVPVATSSEISTSGTYTVAVAKDNSVSVVGGAVSVEKLTARLAELGGTQSDAIVIKAHRETPYRVVVAILDELAKAGYANVSFVATSE